MIKIRKIIWVKKTINL